MKFYFVGSPTWEEVVPVLDYGIGPTEICCDCVYVEARNKRDAIIIGTKLMTDWMRYARKYGENPFAGVTAQEVSKEEVEEYIFNSEQPW